MSGAATNPDPEVFAYAAAQVEERARAHPRPGRRELRALGRARGLRDDPQYRHRRARCSSSGASSRSSSSTSTRSASRAPILVETKPAEPTKHQYDADVATVYGFLARHGLEKEVRINIEQNHALLAGHTLRARDRDGAGARRLRLHRHESRRRAAGLGHGAVSRTTCRSGARALPHPSRRRPRRRRASTSTPRCAASRSIPRTSSPRTPRRSTCARARLLVAEKMIADGELAAHVDARYAGWKGKSRARDPLRQAVARQARQARREERPRAAAALGPARSSSNPSSTGTSDPSRSKDHHEKIRLLLRAEPSPSPTSGTSPRRRCWASRMADHLRFAVCYWHSFVWPGLDPFGGETFHRPWHAAGGNPMKQAHHKADVAFELFRLRAGAVLHLPRPRHRARGRDACASRTRTCARIGEVFEKKMAKSGVKLLWGTANLFTQPALHVGRRDQSRIRRSSPTPRRR